MNVTTEHRPRPVKRHSAPPDQYTHDLNNLFAVMIGNLDHLREMLRDNDVARACAEDALEAALRGTDLTRRLAARQGSIVKQAAPVRK